MNNTPKIIIGIIIILAIAGVWYGANQKPAERGTIKIGAVLSLTGYAASYGEFAQKAINLAVKEINANGGIKGKNVEVLIEDDHTEAKDAVSAFQKLVNVNNVDGVIGSLFDFTTQPLMPLALQNDITLISPPNFRIEGSFEPNADTFVMMPQFSKVIESAKIYIDGQNIKKLAVVRFASPFADEIANVLSGIMAQRGQKEIIDEKYNEIGGNDFRTVVVKLKQEKADAVFLDMMDSDMNNFLQRAKELNFNPKIITYSVILDLLNNPQIDKALLENIFFINWERQPEAFSQKFKQEYGILPAKSADRSYDALYVLATAIGNSADKHAVSEYIEKNSFKTINGEIKFTPEHLIENLPIDLDVVKNGKIVPYSE